MLNNNTYRWGRKRHVFEPRDWALRHAETLLYVALGILIVGMIVAPIALLVYQNTKYISNPATARLVAVATVKKAVKNAVVGESKTDDEYYDYNPFTSKCMTTAATEVWMFKEGEQKEAAAMATKLNVPIRFIKDGPYAYTVEYETTVKSCR